MRTKLRTPEQEDAAFNALTTKEVATRWRCTTAHVTHLITHGEEGRRLRAIDIGAGERPEYRILQEWVEEYERAREVGSAA
jgi:hypothetical protein